MDKPIGVFDSGIGGLTVVKQMIRLTPHEDIIYVGDTARVPYGTRSSRTVIQYALQIAEFLASRDVKMLVVACNTSSAVAMRPLQERFNLPTIGVIGPGARGGSQATRNKLVGVIGTTATIRSESYVEEIRRLDPEIELYLKPCPLLVPLAEEGWTDNEVARLCVAEYLSSLKNENIDTLILGCTHYPLFENVLSRELGPEVTLVDSGVETARQVLETLTEKDMLNSKKAPGERQFYVTDFPEKFQALSPAFLGEDVTNITQISLP